MARRNLYASEDKYWIRNIFSKSACDNKEKKKRGSNQVNSECEIDS